jgi:sugar/nucleoside kinase (ribokinase family)
VQLQFLDALPERQLTVADTMDLWINTARAELDLLLTKIDGLVLNYDEAEQMTGKANAVTAAREVLRMMGGGRPGSKKFVVVKKGEHGSLLATADGLAAIPGVSGRDRHRSDRCGRHVCWRHDGVACGQ